MCNVQALITNCLLVFENGEVTQEMLTPQSVFKFVVGFPTFDVMHPFVLQATKRVQGVSATVGSSTPTRRAYHGRFGRRIQDNGEFGALIRSGVAYSNRLPLDSKRHVKRKVRRYQKPEGGHTGLDNPPRHAIESATFS
jgi:hypothetical protein